MAPKSRLPTFDELHAKYDIEFLNRTVPEEERPLNLRSHFATIDDIRNQRFERFGDCRVNLDVTNVKRRAIQLAAIAHRLKNEQEAIEFEWRRKTEAVVFQRFSMEVNCPLCKRRLWRSNYEVTREPETKEQRRRKERCVCPEHLRTTLGDSCLDEWFSEKAERRFEYPDLKPRKEELKVSKVPDVVVGLRKNGKDDIFHELLTAKIKSRTLAEHTIVGKTTVQEVIKTGPKEDDPHLFFPFIAYEAKGPKHDLSGTEIQTGLAIRELLHMQFQLHEEALHVSKREFFLDPLVWFLGSTAQDWRVWICYVDKERDRISYKVTQVWNGCIMQENDSLQLLLIVDYILDWAREKYRPNILRQLNMLSKKFPDMSRSRINPLSRANTIEESSYNNPPPATDAIWEDWSESENGSVRHAGELKAKTKGLYITTDNLETLLMSFEDDGTAKKFASTICLELKSDLFELEGEDAVSKLEHAWTATPMQRDYHDRSEGRRKIYAKFMVAHYIDLNWEVVREISFIAVAEDALVNLSKAAGMPEKKPRGYTRDTSEHATVLSTEQLISACTSQRLSAASQLDVAIRRRIFRLEPYSRNSKEEVKWVKWSGYLGPVHDIFKICTTGRREPKEPFLRSSQVLLERSGSIIHNNLYAKLRPSTENIVLVFGDCLREDRTTPPLPPLCLYVFGQREKIPKSVDSFIYALKEYHGRTHYCHTVRKGKYFPRKSQEYNNQPTVRVDQEFIHKLPLTSTVKLAPRGTMKDSAPKGLIENWIEELKGYSYNSECSESESEEGGGWQRFLSFLSENNMEV